MGGLTHWPRAPQRQHTTPTKRAARHNAGKSENRRYCATSSVPTINREKRQTLKYENEEGKKTNPEKQPPPQGEERSWTKKSVEKATQQRRNPPLHKHLATQTSQKWSAHDPNPYQQWHVVHRNTGTKNVSLNTKGKKNGKVNWQEQNSSWETSHHTNSPYMK